MADSFSAGSRRTFSPDQIESELARLESIKTQVAAVQARLLAEADRMQLPLADGSRTLAEWLASRLDIAPEKAGDLVHLSRSRGAVNALDTGEQTVDRVLARLKLAQVGATDDVLAFSDGLDLAGVRRLAARHRRMTRVDHRHAFERRHLNFQDTLDGSLTRLWGELAGVDGAIVRDALTEIGDSLPQSPDGSDTLAQRNADALVALCQGDADSPADDGGVTAVVTVDADLAAATGGEAGMEVLAGPRIGPQILEEILCGGNIEVTAISDTGAAYGIGTAGKAIPPRIRRFVMARDGGCVADGCRSRYRLQVHHLRVPRARGGTADPDNLATFCWFHHHVVIHGRGFIPDPTSPPRRIRFISPYRAPP